MSALIEKIATYRQNSVVHPRKCMNAGYVLWPTHVASHAQ